MSGHARERAAWFVGALASAGLAASPAGALPPALALAALAVVFSVLPGASLARVLAPGEASDARASLALVLSPFAIGAPLALARLAGVPAAPAARALALLLALVSAWEAFRPRSREATAPGDPGVWGMALAVALAVAAAHAFSPALSARSDGAFHAGVVWAAERRLPPEDPFFAGLPLRYAWGAHAWAAGWLALAPGLPARVPLVASNAFAALAALLAVGSLARRLGASPRVRVLAQAFALAATAPFAWVVLALRALTGDVRGGAELARALDGGADGALRALDPGLLHPSLVLPLDKFVVLTPFAWGLAGAAVLALALAAALDAPSGRHVPRLAAVAAAVTFAHPAAGPALAGAALAGTAVASLRDPAARRALPALGAACVATGLVLAGYLAALPGAVAAGAGGAASGGLARDPRGAWSALAAGACLLPLAWAALVSAAPRERSALPIAGALAALVLPACALRLGGDNQSKFLNLAFLLAAAPAALGWARLAARPRRALVLGGLGALAFLPTLGAMLWAYARESPDSADAPSRPPAAIVSAVRQLVPRDAVLVDATQDTTRGAAPALPGETGRALLWSGGFMARKWGHPEAALERRAEAAAALGRNAWPRGEAGELLRGLGREAWVIARDDSARASDPRWRVVARADGVLLARFESR